MELSIMAICIIWEQSDQSLVLTMLSTLSINKANLHKEDLIARGQFHPSEFRAFLDTSELPRDRYFRPAWIWDGTKIELDLEKCRARHLQKLRKARRNLLQATDAETLKALEGGDVVRLAALTNYRQALRDMPKDVQPMLLSASTPEAIRAVRPAILGMPQP